MSLFGKRLVFVSGKGGVGKSTVSAALAMAAARRGRRTLVVEVAAQERMSRLFEAGPIGYRRTPVYPNLDALSIDPQRALEEYLLAQVRIRAVYERLFENRVFTYFAAATPGLREIVTLAKAATLLEDEPGRRAYDLIVVDAPATGHGLSFLRVPRTFLDIARSGPVRARAEWLTGILEDPACSAVVLVTTPEELPVTETLEAVADLAPGPIALAGVVANAVYPPLLDDAQVAALRPLEAASDPLAAAAVRAAASRQARTADQAEQLARLGPVIARLPFLFEERLDRRAVARLSEELAGL